MSSYGNEGYECAAGASLPYSSDAERDFITIVAAKLQSGEITYFVWQPPEIPLLDKQGEPADPYRPDAFIRWDSGEEWFVEVKRGRIEQIAKKKMLAFCRQYPDKKLVMAWFGPLKRRGPTKRRLDELKPWLDHIWYL